jgi:hypothetical protein
LLVICGRTNNVDLSALALDSSALIPSAEITHD